jgi:O-antigen/teichoic acid export membrane protein
MIMYLDRIVTAKLVSVEMVTTLALTGRMYALAWNVLQQVTGAARPALAQMIGAGDYEGIRGRYHQIFSISTGLAIISATSIWAGNAAFIAWWVGAQNYGGGLLDAFLALNLVVHTWVLPNRAILVAGMAFVPQNAIGRFVEGILNITLSILLGIRYGISGIVAATAISGILISCWYFPWLMARYFGMSLFKLFAADVAKMALLSFFMVSAAYICRHLGDRIGGFFGIITASLSCAVAGIICIWYIVFDRELKEVIKALLRRKFSPTLAV